MGRHKGFTVSAETRAKLSALRKGKKRPGANDTRRIFRVVRAKWKAGQAKAKIEGTTLPAKIRGWLDMYIS